MVVVTLGPVNSSVLKYQSNSWNSEEIREWAEREFPEDFRALPDTNAFIFRDWTENGNPVANTKLLRIGIWKTKEHTPTGKVIYTFITRSRSNQIGFFIKDLGTREFGTRLVDNIAYYAPITGINGYRALDHPFRHLQDPAATFASLPRFRALISCSWIANGGVRPKRDPLASTPLRLSRDDVIPVDESASSTQKQSEDERSARVAGSGKAGKSLSFDHDQDQVALESVKAKDHVLNSKTTIEDVSEDGNNLKRLFYEAGNAYEKMGASKKRIKQDLESIRVEYQQLKAANETLTIGNSRMQGELEQAERDKNASVHEHRVLSESLAASEKRAGEAKTKEVLKFANDREQHAAQIQEWGAKCMKAEAKLNQERTAAEDYKMRAGLKTAELLEKKAEFAVRMKREKARADAAEEKLASIQALFGKTV